MENEILTTIMKELANKDNTNFAILEKELRKSFDFAMKNKTFYFSDDKEELYNETLMRLFERAASYNSEMCKVTTWYTNIIVKYTYLDYLRDYDKSSSREAIESTLSIGLEEDEEFSMDNFASKESLEDNLISDMGCEEIEKVIRGLKKDNYREVAIKVLLEGKKNQEVAKEMGCKPEDVTNWLFRSRKAIQKELCDNGFEMEL